MSTHKHIDRVCAAVLALTLILTVLFIQGKSLGLEAAPSALGYEERLFAAGQVHTIDLRMEDWEGFLETCTNEEYQLCSLTIDGEAVESAAIRAKGNTSLTSVAAYGNDRYSFKVEFDHYDGAGAYHGLDKLSLNNLIQDNTCMKDFLVYRLMAAFGAAAPLCSYVWLTVNGEPWGLYLAVEGIEDAFLERNYGSAGGNLYKPDSMSFGGGRGNGGGFDMEALTEDFAFSDMPERPAEGEGRRQNGGFPGGGMGSSDAKLQYVDDDPDSYPNIFDNAKTALTDADKARLIAALKILGGEGNIEDAVDVEQVIRYLVVHGFVCNGDSYTGSMVHNYYLYEEGGVLSMLPWDYNLAFGGFQTADASGAVNEPIDTPVTGGSLEDRPMAAWIFRSEEHTALYHQYYSEFLSSLLESGWCDALIDETAAMIAPYIAEDPTKFCTEEEFETGVAALKDFCTRRTQSVRGQLDGSIPSTTQGQSENPSALVDCAGLDLSDMGAMGMGGGPGGGFTRDASGRGKPSELPAEENIPAMMPGETDFSPPQEDAGRPSGDTGRMPEQFPEFSASGGGNDGMTSLLLSAGVLAAGLLFAAA
jgi:spore coat protein CotH